MTSGPIWRQLLGFSLPMAAGLLFQQLYNTVDTIVVGQFVGKEALAAVGSTSSIVNMLVGFCAGLATGASVVIAQCYGAHDEEKLRSAVSTTMAMTLIMCVVVTPIGVLLVNPMLRLMNAPPDVFVEASEYLTIYFSGVAGLLIYNMGSGILRAVGDSRRPLYFLCISAGSNIALDLLFVVKFHWGVAGVSYATIISQALSSVLTLLSLSFTDAPYGVRWKKLRIHRDMLGRILSVGLPSGLQQFITAFSNVFVQSYVNSFGSACMAGWSSYNKVDAFLGVPVQSLALTASTFVGQNYGAGNLARARKGVNQSLFMSLGISAVCGAAVMLLAGSVLRLFTPDPEVIRYGEEFIMLITPFYLLLSVNQIFASALRGAGHSKAPMLIMLGSFVVFRQIYLYVNALLGNSFVPVALAYPVGWVMCSILLTIAYLRSELCRATQTAKLGMSTD